MEEPIFNIGDIVTPKSERDAKQIGSRYIKYGDTFKVINNNGGFIVGRLSINVKLNSGRDYGIFQDRLMYASECHKCIHACKMKERCALFEKGEL